MCGEPFSADDIPLNTLDTRLIDDSGSGKWLLLSPFVYDSKLIGRVVVPKGYITDFASVPRIAVAYWLAGNTCRRAATVHDWLCDGGPPKVSRSMADAVFNEIAIVYGIPWWRRIPMWTAIRLYGIVTLKG